jgi:2-polyprenyl-3-methyl-5-hydroxy-6-metoxy-1,4-benzoquinol methylase
MASGEGVPPTVEERAAQSQGVSNDAIYRMVVAALAGRHPGGGIILDVGCGRGLLRPYVADMFERYIGADVVRYDGFPEDCEFHKVDLDNGRVPLPDGAADVVAAVETIEHLENPRAFVRELVRLARPGGWVVVTTPNQLSLLSKLTLLLRNEFNAFRAASYPAHITALLEVDLLRIASENRLTEVAIRYTGQGRIPGTSWHWPHLFSRLAPRTFSDNVLMIGRKSFESAR